MHKRMKIPVAAFLLLAYVCGCGLFTRRSEFYGKFVTGSYKQRMQMFEKVKWTGKTKSEVEALMGEPDMNWGEERGRVHAYGWSRQYRYKGKVVMHYFRITFKNGRVLKAEDLKL